MHLQRTHMHSNMLLPFSMTPVQQRTNTVNLSGKPCVESLLTVILGVLYIPETSESIPEH